MTTSTDSLTRAIEYLGAQWVGSVDKFLDGTSREVLDYSVPRALDAQRTQLYAYLDRNSDAWHIVTDVTLELLSESLAHKRLDSSREAAYQDWCDDTKAVRMPSWWTPTQQFAWRVRNTDTGHSPSIRFTADHYADDYCADRPDEWLTIDRIGVNLETGEEVSA